MKLALSLLCTRGAPLIALAALFLAAVTATPLSAAAAARFQLPSNSGDVVIRISERIGEIESDDHPWLAVHADGRIVRHTPAYLRNAGDYTGQMSLVDLQGLLQSLSDQGVMEFDSQGVQAEMTAAKSKQPRVFEASDLSVFTIEVNLDEYQPAGSLSPQRDFTTTIQWEGLRHDAQRFPGIASIQNLLAATQQLSGLADRAQQRLSSDDAGGEE